VPSTRAALEPTLPAPHLVRDAGEPVAVDDTYVINNAPPAISSYHVTM